MSPFREEIRSGWRSLLAATVGLGLGIPAYLAISSLFLQAMSVSFGWSHSAAAAGLIALPITAIALPFAGLLTDRYGVRSVTAVSVLCFVACLVLLSRQSGRLGEYYALFIALNILGCATGPITYTRLVIAKFRRSRGAALAIAQFGIALLAMLLPPLIGAVIRDHGWRNAYLAVAALALLGGVIAQLTMQPESRAARYIEGEGLTIRETIRRPSFWLLGFSLLAISAAELGLVTQFQPVLLDRGVERQATTWLLSLLSASVMISRLIVGRLLDYRRPAMWAGAVLLVAAIGGLVLIEGQGMPLLAFAILLIGFGIGAELDLMAFFCARFFGRRHYSAIYGLLSGFYYVGMAAGGIGYGVIRDRTGSFTPAICGTFVLLLIAAGVFLLLDRIDRRLATDGVHAWSD